MDLGSPRSLLSRGWKQVTTGDSGAVVLRSADSSRYAKFVAAEQQALLETERDRLQWAGAHDVPTAPVLDWATSDDWACLLTSAVPGAAADRLSAAALWRAWPSITNTLRQLHALPVQECPFDRGLKEMFGLARNVVGRAGVNPQFLPVEVRHRAPEELLAELEGERSQRQAEEEADLVVCHGDLCLPNVIIDPGTDRVAGVIDLGRLGRADRYGDIALLLSNSRATWTDETEANAADARFADGYGISLSPERMHYYLCLDALTWDTR